MKENIPIPLYRIPRLHADCCSPVAANTPAICTCELRGSAVRTREETKRCSEEHVPAGLPAAHQVWWASFPVTSVWKYSDKFSSFDAWTSEVPRLSRARLRNRKINSDRNWKRMGNYSVEARQTYGRLTSEDLSACRTKTGLLEKWSRQLEAM